MRAACGQSPFDTPFDVVADDPAIRTAQKRTLLAISRHLEEQARNSEKSPIVLTAVQRGINFGLPTRHRYAALAAVCPLVAVFGTDLALDQSAAVRAVELDASDPLCSQWVVVTLGPHTAAALVARERSGQPAATEDDREFDFVVTHDRTVVTAVASALLSRVL